MVTVTAPQFKSSAMEISPEQDFEVTIKAAGKIVPPEIESKSDYFRWW
jgi:hypothetical protein